VAGAALRLLWPADFQFKHDEARNLEFGLAIAREGRWVSHAWPTSVGIPAGPVPAYVFAAIARFTTDPLAANLAVALLNIAALAAAAPLYRRLLPDRDDARTAFALHATSPVAIWFSRKIWDPCLLPIVAVPALWIAATALARRSWTVALLPPLLALAAQTHPTGLFFGAALLAALLARPRAIAWGPFAIGCLAAGAIAAPYAASLARLLLGPAGPPPLQSVSRYPDIDVITNIFLDASGHNVLDAAGRDALPLLAWPVPPIGLLVILAGLPFYACLVAGYAEAARRPGGPRRLLLGVALGLPIAFLALRVRGVPHYFVSIFPVLFALTALGARRLREARARGWRLAAPPAGALAAVNVATWLLFATYVHAHWGGESYGLPYGRLVTACEAVAADAAARGIGTAERPLRLRVDTWRERGPLPTQYAYVLERRLGMRVEPPRAAEGVDGAEGMASAEHADLVLAVRWPRGGRLRAPPFAIRDGGGGDAAEPN
jgi:hypothetical protein